MEEARDLYLRAARVLFAEETFDELSLLLPRLHALESGARGPPLEARMLYREGKTEDAYAILGALAEEGKAASRFIPLFYSSKEAILESVTLTSIQAARARIGEAIYVSPCQLSSDLSELTGLPLHLKLENLQRTGSFKERGALNKLLTLSEAERERGVITASAGNHAQGVAFHAAALRHSRADRDAAGHAADQGGGHARLRRGGDPARRQLRRGLRRGAAPPRRGGPHLHPSLRRP